ncbi:MAG: CRTAC1 family protein [Planctomycetaceae bacterium]|nr:CRTAC1 family protein [Planctomycetaceae bacterium]
MKTENKDSSDTVPQVETEEVPADDSVIGTALMWSAAVALLLVIVGAFSLWWFNRTEPPPPPQQTPLTLPKVRQTPTTVTRPNILFTDITEEAGIRFVHENGATGEKLLPETMGGGCAFLDFDDDGDQDLLLVNSNRWPWDKRPQETPPTLALYQNDGTGKFADVTKQWGLDVSFYGMGVAVGDYDNDGRVDLFFTAVGPNRLFHNTGERFVDVTEVAGLVGGANEWGTSCGWFDYDNDGRLDLFVCNYVRWNREFDLAQNFQLTGGGRAYGRPQVFEGSHPHLYHNDGDGKFSDVSKQAGIQVEYEATGTALAKSLGLSFADVDGDGLLDVVVTNDTVRNFLFRNQGDGSFDEVGVPSGIAFDNNGKARGAMGADAAHFRNNNSVGIAVGNFSNEMTALYVARDTNLQFRDEAVSNGLGPVTRLELTFGLFFFDADLDGRLDLFAANGHLEEDINKVQASQHYEQPPQLLWNSGPEHPDEFLPLPVDNTGEDFARPMVGRGTSFADIDGDGDLDILITAVGREPRLLRNDLLSTKKPGHHWLRLKLIGKQCNRDAIGSMVEVQLGKRTLKQQVMPTRSYLSQTELPVTFGLGQAEKVDHVRIRWADGTTQEIPSPEVDRLIRIEQQPITKP